MGNLFSYRHMNCLGNFKTTLKYILNANPRQLNFDKHSTKDYTYNGRLQYVLIQLNHHILDLKLDLFFEITFLRALVEHSEMK